MAIPPSTHTHIDYTMENITKLSFLDTRVKTTLDI